MAGRAGSSAPPLVLAAVGLPHKVLCGSCPGQVGGDAHTIWLRDALAAAGIRAPVLGGVPKVGGGMRSCRAAGGTSDRAGAAPELPWHCSWMACTSRC